MHKGLNRASLGVLGSALLAGSVYAAGPTLQSLPTVVITDLHEISKQQSGIEYDFETSVTENRYRFTIAFDLADYVNYKSNTPSELDEVHFLFNEFDEPGTTEQSTISINGQTAFVGVPTHADIINSANDVGVVGTDGVLDFINEDRSPGGSPGANPGGLFTDIALLDMYVASDDPSTGTDIDVKSFNVITTNDTGVATGDTLLSSTILEPISCVDTFEMWHVGFTFQGLASVNTVPPTLNATTSNDPASSTNPTVPYESPVFAGNFVDAASTPAATLDISNALSSGNTAGFAPHYWAWHSFRRDYPDNVNDSVLVERGNLYMIRWTVSGDASTTQADSIGLPGLRFRAGEASSFGIGQSQDVFAEQGANNIAGNTPQQHRSYYYAMADGEIGFYFDMLNFWDSTGTATTPAAVQSQLTLDRLEVLKLDPSELSGGVQELNHGAASVTIASDGLTVAPPSTGRVDFTIDTDGPGGSDTDGDWNGREIIFASVDRLTMSGTANSLQFDVIAGNGHFIGNWDTLGYLVNQAGYPSPWPTNTEILTAVPNDKLIRLDVWIRSPQGSTTDNTLPIIRAGIQTDAWGESADFSSAPFRIQGRASYHVWNGWNRTVADVGDLIAPVLGLQTASRQYTVFMEPNIKAPYSTIDVRPTIDVYSFAANTTSGEPNPNFNAAHDAGTIIVDRVVMTTYDLPGDAATASICP